ncbi:MAG: site-2 protease family protein, partial [Desulfovibrio sp.]|nr:site-2 protease family protein [Desulfovibrio sp.]
AMAFGLGLWAAVRVLPFAELRTSQVYIFALSSLQAGVVINFGLGWLNLLPIPPLDGSKILAYFLPAEWAWRYMGLGRYGFVILLGLLATGLLGKLLGPLVSESSLGLLTLLGF